MCHKQSFYILAYASCQKSKLLILRPAYYAENVILLLQGARVRGAIMSTKVQYATILAPYATAPMMVLAGGSSATDVLHAVKVINLTSSVLARYVFIVIPVITAPMTRNGRCTPSISLGRN